MRMSGGQTFHLTESDQPEITFDPNPHASHTASAQLDAEPNLGAQLSSSSAAELVESFGVIS
jgi:hypothetical protein